VTFLDDQGIGTINNTDDPYVDCPDPIVNDSDPGICADTIDIPFVDLSYWPQADLAWSMSGEHDVSGTDQIGQFVFNVGVTTITYTVDDEISNNSASCTFTVTVEDNENPVARCQDLLVVLDTEGNGSITPAEVNDGSSDNCGILEMLLDSLDFDCSDLGENTVELMVIDIHRNRDSCTATITVEPGTELPDPWEDSDIGIVNSIPGWAEFNACADEEFTEGSSAFNYNPYQDAGHYIYRQLCCDASIVAKVNSIQTASSSPPGKAGVMIRETLDQGSKMVSLSMSMTYWLWKYWRGGTNYPANFRQYYTFMYTWLKLERTGPFIRGYSKRLESDPWSFMFQDYIPMDDCIYVGLFTESYFPYNEFIANFIGVEASCGGSPPTLESDDDPEVYIPEQTEAGIDVYPNPATSEVNLRLEGFGGKDVRVMVFDPLGKQISEQELEGIWDHTEVLDFSNPYYSGGIYKVTVISDDTVLTKALIIVK